MGSTLNDVYVQHINSSGMQLWAAGGIAMGTLISGTGEIAIVADPEGGVVVAFTSGSNIYIQRFNANGDKMWNAGAPATVCDVINNQTHPRMILSNLNQYVIAWQDERSGTNAVDIYAQKFGADGVAQWFPNGIVVNAAAESQYNPEILDLGAGETNYYLG